MSGRAGLDEVNEEDFDMDDLDSVNLREDIIQDDTTDVGSEDVFFLVSVVHLHIHLPSATKSAPLSL